MLMVPGSPMVAISECLKCSTLGSTRAACFRSQLLTQVLVAFIEVDTQPQLVNHFMPGSAPKIGILHGSRLQSHNNVSGKAVRSGNKPVLGVT